MLLQAPENCINHPVTAKLLGPISVLKFHRLMCYNNNDMASVRYNNSNLLIWLQAFHPIIFCVKNSSNRSRVSRRSFNFCGPGTAGLNMLIIFFFFFKVYSLGVGFFKIFRSQISLHFQMSSDSRHSALGNTYVQPSAFPDCNEHLAQGTAEIRNIMLLKPSMGVDSVLNRCCSEQVVLQHA